MVQNQRHEPDRTFQLENIGFFASGRNNELAWLDFLRGDLQNGFKAVSTLLVSFIPINLSNRIDKERTAPERRHFQTNSNVNVLMMPARWKVATNTSLRSLPNGSFHSRNRPLRLQGSDRPNTPTSAHNLAILILQELSAEEREWLNSPALLTTNAYLIFITQN